MGTTELTNKAAHIFLEIHLFMEHFTIKVAGAGNQYQKLWIPR